MKKYKTGDYEERPWGSWEVLSDETLNPGCIIKRIIVKPGKRLSLQYHFHRNELWFVSKGTALAIKNNIEFKLSFGSTFSIPAGALHRLENIGDEDLVIIEIQSGHILNEDDIVRISDDFNRI